MPTSVTAMRMAAPVAAAARRSSSSTSSSVRSRSFDVAIVGGGIVGLAAAQELVHRYPDLSLTLLEKETSLASHQSGHNSGVIHAGIYYKPGSLMAKLCVEGLHSTYRYCDRHGIPYKKCGKLVVATSDLEESRLRDLFSRAEQNGVPDLALVDSPSRIAEIEPSCLGGSARSAIWSPHTGIVDWAVVARQYGKVFEEKGGKIERGFEVVDFRPREEVLHLFRSVQNAVTQLGIPMTIFLKSFSEDGNSVDILGRNPDQRVTASYVLTCAGLHSDRIAFKSGCSSEPKIVPFRGEYLLLCPEKAKLITRNIYPVPDPNFPFLGVHFTPRMNGEVWLGPNAVLAFDREGYSWSHVNFRDLLEIMSYPGFYKLARKYFNFGSKEVLRSIFISLSVRELQKFVPSVSASDISRGPAGVRAQAMNAQGDLIGDFIFDTPPPSSSLSGRILHCRNAPSPGATSSLAIARMLADKVSQEFGLPKRPTAELY